jgi:hypothetical protein
MRREAEQGADFLQLKRQVFEGKNIAKYVRKHKSRRRKPFLVCANIFHDTPAFFGLNKLFSCSANIYLLARTFLMQRKPFSCGTSIFLV